MHMDWNDKQKEMRARYEEIGRAWVAPRAALLYEQGQFDRASWLELCRAGFWRIPVPERYGGLGHTWWEFVVALEGLAATARDLGFLLSTVAHIGLIRSLLEFGTEEQRRRYLPSLMNGSVGATAMTEPSGGSDVARLATRAARHGSHYLLNGEKAHITNAPIADLMLVLGRIPDLGERKDITLFLLERGAPGLVIGEPESLLGNRTSPTGPLCFHDLEVHEDQIVGTAGRGLETIYNVIALDRLLYGVIAAGYIEPILDDALRYASTRESFRARLTDHQYIQGRLTDMQTAMESARWISYAALAQLIDGSPAASRTCSVAKLVGTEALCLATQHAMNIFGHVGYEDGSIARAVRDALGTRIAGGTAEMQRKNIFNQMVRQMEERMKQEQHQRHREKPRVIVEPNGSRRTRDGQEQSVHAAIAPAGARELGPIQVPRDGAARIKHPAVPGEPPDGSPGARTRRQLETGLTGELLHEVDRGDSAATWGNDLEVLATPVLLWLGEMACVQALEGVLESGKMTVGAAHDVEHLAPTPVGASLTVRATLVQVEGRRLRFQLWASDGTDVVLRGTHDRVVIDRTPFLARIQKKRPALREMAAEVRYA